MEGEFVKYCGRMVPKEGFRAFIYNREGHEKLVNTWQQYEDYMAVGTWYASKEDIPAHDEPEDDKVKKKGR